MDINNINLAMSDVLSYCYDMLEEQTYEKHSEFLESLTPILRKRVDALREIQSQHDELEAKFLEEKAALEAKYQKLYQPLYAKRYAIVSGEVEVSDVQTEEANKEEKGVPGFWFAALKNNAVVGEEITDRDEKVLNYLKDIKWSKTDYSKGFKLEFFFDTNPYFKNSVLTKTYHMVDEDEPISRKAIGTEIEWYSGKCLTQKMLIDRKGKSIEGSKKATLITEPGHCGSFFHFFTPLQVPEDEKALDKESAEELENQMERDYDVGTTIKDVIIPHAVSWFTGEAVKDDYDSDDEDDDDYMYLDDDEDDDE